MKEIEFRIFDKRKNKMLGVSALSIDERMFMPNNINYQDFYSYDNQYYSDILEYTGLKDKKKLRTLQTENMYDISKEKARANENK